MKGDRKIEGVVCSRCRRVVPREEALYDRWGFLVCTRCYIQLEGEVEPEDWYDE